MFYLIWFLFIVAAIFLFIAELITNKGKETVFLFLCFMFIIFNLAIFTLFFFTRNMEHTEDFKVQNKIENTNVYLGKHNDELCFATKEDNDEYNILMCEGDW